MISRHTPSISDDVTPILSQLQAVAHPLKAAADLDPIVDRIGDARYVLLGEASHGTSEYFLWRHRLTERLIREKGFTLVAVQGDWSDCYRVHRFTRWLSNTADDPVESLRHFAGWPAWLWLNREIASLVEWLRTHNESLPDDRKVGFHGLDVYSLWDSLRLVVEHLDRVDGSAAAAFRRAMECFEPYQEDLQEYARATAGLPESLAGEVMALLRKRREESPRFDSDGPEGSFFADQNALAATNADSFYGTLLHGGSEAWNVWQRHMVETLERLMHQRGPMSKAIVWAHNTYIGDARFTDMNAAGLVNMGQLLRESHAAHDVVSVGFGSYGGTVVASPAWGEPAQRMNLPPAPAGTWEDLLHRVAPADKLLVFGPAAETPELLAERGHRAVGVVYRPQSERYGNYIPTVLPRRYDAFIYCDRIHPLHPWPARSE